MSAVKRVLKRFAAGLLCGAVMLGAVSCAGEEENARTTLSKLVEESPVTDYSDPNNWIRFDDTDREADVFLIAPTVDSKDEYNMDVTDEKLRGKMLSALNAQVTVYEETARVYSPYYSQGSMKLYSGMTDEEREPYLRLAYRDISAAFEYYLKNRNNGRPIILAGFSQGADMCYRLLEDHFGSSKLKNQLVACYAPGWALTDEMTAKYPQIVAAKSADDIGVVVSFECEAEGTEGSLVCPKGSRIISINPLSWSTDTSKADKSLNKGACFFDSKTGAMTEIPGLCGCYIDPGRGTLIVTDIDKADYPALLPGQEEGVYHIYDPYFFYRNIQENVRVRTEAYLAANGAGELAA